MKRVDRFALLFPFLCAGVVFLLLLWGRQRLETVDAAGIEEAAVCPICEMDVDTGEDAVSYRTGRGVHYFCSEYCLERFMDSLPDASETGNGALVDPVCGMEVRPGIDSSRKGTTYSFCTTLCRDRFEQDSERYLVESCLVCRSRKIHTPVDERGDFAATWEGKTYRFCSLKHRDAFRHDPAGYFIHTMWGIPNWLYYSSIAFILVISFGIIEWKSRRPQAAAGTHLDPESARRFDLLKSGRLRALITWPGTRFLAQVFLVAVFLLILGAGLFGNQLPSRNIAPILTWTVWWGGLIWLVAYAGKAWCYVCPWDAIAGWSEKGGLWGTRRKGFGLGLRWPKALRNIWPATILFVGLTWIELGFGVTMKPRVTAWLGLGMLGLAFVSAFIFDRKSFCRYGCLVGRISGLYALFSPIEVRARDRESCRSCGTLSCYKGNESGEGCPTFERLPAMDQNTYCICCMECVKTCEKRNVSINLRPWGEDLSHHHRPRSDEAYLALLMVSLTGFHGLTMTGAWRSFAESIKASTGVGELAAFSGGMAAVMAGPPVLYAVLVGISWWWARTKEVGYREYFIRYAYALLPIALFYHIAHNSEHLLMEGQKVLALASDPFGFRWDLFGTAERSIPPLTDLSTLWIIQVFFVVLGHVYSLWIARRVAGGLFSDGKTARRSQVPMLIAMILFSLMSLWLLKQPMEMRTSAM